MVQLCSAWPGLGRTCYRLQAGNPSKDAHGGLMNVTSLHFRFSPPPSVRTEAEKLSRAALEKQQRNAARRLAKGIRSHVSSRNEINLPREARLYAGPADISCSILRSSGGE